VYACLGIDHTLLDVERHDLDPTPRQRIFEAQNSTRVDERSSVEQRAAMYARSVFKFPNLFFSDYFSSRFLNVCRSQCPAVNSNGKSTVSYLGSNCSSLYKKILIPVG
jgi:hypothetical protein